MHMSKAFSTALLQNSGSKKTIQISQEVKASAYHLIQRSHLFSESKHLKQPVPRKLPTKRVYRQVYHQFKLFEEQDKVKSFNDIDSTLTPPGYTFQKYDDHAVFYHLETNVLNVPEVTDCVRVSRDLCVKVARVVNLKLVFTDYFLYNVTVLIK